VTEFSSQTLGHDTQGQFAIDVVIGIDYGTRFTKIAVAIGNRRQVILNKKGEGLLIPSTVFIGTNGEIVSFPDPQPAGSVKIEYLKMLLAGADNNLFQSVRTNINGKPLHSLVQPLAAFFLGNLVRHIRRAMLQGRPELPQRKINWFLNVGAPVQHCDADLKAFKEVAAVAFEWGRSASQKLSLDQLSETYVDTLRKIDLDSSPAFVVPELTAALHEFVRDPNRADALYGFVDIGGGTIDGAIFHVNRSEIGSPLRIHCAKVACAGTMAVSRLMLAQIYLKISDHIEFPLLGTSNNPTINIPLAEPLSFHGDQSARDEVQNVIGTIAHQTSQHIYPGTGKDFIHLRIFLAGGGASSAWYKNSIERTFVDRNLHQFGYSGLHAELVGKPAGYSGNDYSRFVVALGLADPNASLVDAMLPSQFRKAELNMPPPKVPDYMDTKDWT
jgi:hypothetical protein